MPKGICDLQGGEGITVTACCQCRFLKTNVQFKTKDKMENKNSITDESKALQQADVSSSARYIIVDSSVSAHCCFAYTIIDTVAGKESYGDYWKRTMCETFEEEEAKIICDALNKHCC